MFYSKITPFIAESTTFKQLNEAIDLQENIEINNLNISLKALLIADSFMKSDKNILVVVSDDKLAEDFQSNIEVILSSDLVQFIPDYETLPYEARSPHSTIRALRVRALSQIVTESKSVYICSLRTALRNLMPSKFLTGNVKSISVGDEYDPDQLMSELSGLGYEIEYQVAKVGQASKRGGIVDIYSPNNSLPTRIEFFGDEIESMRFFSPENQKSKNIPLKTTFILPFREVSLHQIKANSPLQDKITEDGFYEGIEQDVAMLYDNTETLIDYFKGNVSIFWDEFKYVQGDSMHLFNESLQLYERALRKDKDAIVVKPNQLFQDFSYIQDVSSITTSVFLSSSQQKAVPTVKSLSLDFNPIGVFNADFAKFEEDMHKHIDDGYRVIIQSDNESQRSRIKELLAKWSGVISFTIGVFHKGFILPDLKLALYTDHEIYNRFATKRTHSKFSKKESLVDYEALNPGDYIVHIDYGIGLFEGLKRMEIDGNKIDCLILRYSGGDKIYVPTFQIQLVSKYISDEGHEPVIHKIGGKKWSGLKSKAKKHIEVIAADIVKLYAERKMRVGVAHEPDTPWQVEMEDAFLYEETKDQLTTAAEIKDDMESPICMERLLCGDVGFGKTEIAIRAAFKAVMSGYQVAILVPTTLLAEQHYIVFRERLAQYPITVAMLSRFRTPRRIKQDIIDISEGSVDIAIGTHRLLSKDVAFKKLGLFIIDEEHRFGVRQKEKIRQLKSNVDTLYMSATPIPRTLSMALSKLKDISLIKTSPKERLPVRTIVSPFDDEVIKDAIQREVDRGGQVFFLHNRVNTIRTVAANLEQMLPNVRFRVGHGQMSGKMLEQLIIDFYQHKFDVLISTTIIENGIDIPNANTMIVNRADNFGLAQLYQIRGRVGRSNRRAYAYFLVPENISLDARERLNALTEYDYLGAGYQIALRDLEIRGAGSLLGTQQSGTIKSVGFNYYNRLLREAMESLDKNKIISFDEHEKRENLEALKIKVDFYFPETYISDEKERITLYRRMKAIENITEFDDLKSELEDRFGKLPSEALHAIQYFELRLLGNKIGLLSCNVKNKKMVMEYPSQHIPPKKVIMTLISEIKHPVKFDTAGNFKITFTLKNCKNASLIGIGIDILKKYLNILSSNATKK